MINKKKEKNTKAQLNRRSIYAGILFGVGLWFALESILLGAMFGIFMAIALEKNSV
jgi:hypothetical protein